MKKFIQIFIISMICLPLFAQSWQGESLVSVRGTSVNNIGELKQLWESGTALYLSYENLSSNNFSYMFQAGYINYKQNSGYEFEGEDPYFYVIPLQVGGRYYILTNWIRPFFMAMTGVNIVSSNYALMPDEEDTGHEEYSGTNLKLNFQVGLGLAIKLFSNLQLEVLANYNSHVLDVSTHYNITGLEFGVGLNWAISK
jgi:hypothetical protein